MKKNHKKETNVIPGTKSGRCPYCGSPIVLRSADGIYRENNDGTMLYACSRYPECDTYVRVIPGTRTAVGTMANAELRALRREAHQHFDLLHQSGIMTRRGAYEWLSSMLQAPLSQTHIGYMSDYYCRQVIKESKQMLNNWRNVHGAWNRLPPTNQASGGELYAAK